MLVAQILMVVTLILMVTGKTPLYLTAIVGSMVAALAAGFPITGKADITLVKLINSGLNPVIADMTGVLMFIGAMEACGFLDVVIKKIMQVGTRIGGGPGVTAAGALVAGIIGALTGFTQPAVTAVVTGPAAMKMGVEPSKAAGLAAHAGHFGNFAGFTHPTQVAVIATAAIGFGAINVVGAITGLSIILFSYFRLRYQMRKAGKELSQEEVNKIAATMKAKSDVSFGVAITPFLVFCVGFILGFPIFAVGVISGILTAILAKQNIHKSESAMLEGVGKIATPLVATIGFLFMSAVMNKIGLVNTIDSIFAPVVGSWPILTMLLVSSVTGFLTQSNAASAGVIIPFLQVVLATGADPLLAACAAAGGSAVWQYFLTGGPVAALSTVIPVIPGSELKAANRFQRPAMVFGFVVLAVCIFVMSIF